MTKKHFSEDKNCRIICLGIQVNDTKHNEQIQTIVSCNFKSSSVLSNLDFMNQGIIELAGIFYISLLLLLR